MNLIVPDVWSDLVQSVVWAAKCEAGRDEREIDKSLVDESRVVGQNN